MITNIEKTILSSYLNLEYFNRATTAHIQPEFFESEEVQTFMKECILYTTKHQSLPTKTTLKTILENKIGLKESQFININKLVDDLYEPEFVQDIKMMDSSWLLSTTENWCIERSAFNAVMKSMDILEGRGYDGKVKLEKSVIPELLQKAISISFDSSIGHDYLNDHEARYEYMHSPVSKIPFAIPILNTITGGGIERKSQTIIVCPPHSGKSLTMASWGCDWLRMGYNILVITLEMAEMKIGERMDANLLNIDIGDLKRVPKDKYLTKFKKFIDDGYGKLKIKEYPTSSAGSSHFRFLLQELEVKQGFIPDVVVIDYMGICISSRMKSDNMYQVQKAVGEELRGLAQEKNFALVTAVQTNKNGFNGADFDIGDISESSSHGFTADFILGLISTDELIQLNQVRVKQLKNRWGSIHENSSFILNMDRKKMKVFEDTPNYVVSHRKPKDEKIDNIDAINNEGDDGVFVFDRSMIRPKKQINTDSFIT